MKVIQKWNMKDIEYLKEEKKAYLDKYSYDFLTSYNFVFKTYRGWDKLIYENEFLELEIAYEINQYGIMLFVYMTISPRRSNKRYEIKDILIQQNIENVNQLIREYEKGKETGGIQTTEIAILLILNKYVPDILNGENTNWEANVKPTCFV